MAVDAHTFTCSKSFISLSITLLTRLSANLDIKKTIVSFTFIFSNFLLFYHLNFQFNWLFRITRRIFLIFLTSSHFLIKNTSTQNHQLFLAELYPRIRTTLAIFTLLNCSIFYKIWIAISTD